MPPQQQTITSPGGVAPSPTVTYPHDNQNQYQWDDAVVRPPEHRSSFADDMVAPFFLVAAVLLILALLYSIVFLCIMRLGTFYIDEDNMLNGRIYFCNGRFYIPLCWFIRLYHRRQMIVDHRDDDDDAGSVTGGRGSRYYVPRDERREALSVILDGMSHKAETEEEWSSKHGAASASTHPLKVDLEGARCKDVDVSMDESVVESVLTHQGSVSLMDISIGDVFQDPVCSICLCDYEEGETYIAPKCPHRFHKDCIIEWLEVRQNTACPCCRKDIITNEEIYEVAKKIRRRERQHRGEDNFRGRMRRLGRRCRESVWRTRRREGEEPGIAGRGGTERTLATAEETATGASVEVTLQGFENTVASGGEVPTTTPTMTVAVTTNLDNNNLNPTDVDNDNTVTIELLGSTDSDSEEDNSGETQSRPGVASMGSNRNITDLCARVDQVGIMLDKEIIGDQNDHCDEYHDCRSIEEKDLPTHSDDTAGPLSDATKKEYVENDAVDTTTADATESTCNIQSDNTPLPQDDNTTLQQQQHPLTESNRPDDINDSESTVANDTPLTPTEDEQAGTERRNQRSAPIEI
eukprot:CAMPEP_0172523638 /NCGR_PEP_ID=MMETSP1066-20121228/293761_1 /TAXON_ID=671091 /ORGANISM="Coscinodiscus wailesii, Strain CCMP2513" /LENGTH=577 /DNA_ID=CAMNT_0013306721 /DNA_START=484 /DNA_END=2217 /DNA_ORIENTATION=+